MALSRRTDRPLPTTEPPPASTPTPQRAGTYGNVDPLSGTPATLEEWTEPVWLAWMTHEDPRVPWLDRGLKARVEDFELVLKSRFPSVNDARTASWGKALGRVLAHRRWARADYADPSLLRAVRRMAQRQPDDRQAYGHLRPSARPVAPAPARVEEALA